jgi:hypothetical protein
MFIDLTIFRSSSIRSSGFGRNSLPSLVYISQKVHLSVFHVFVTRVRCLGLCVYVCACEVDVLVFLRIQWACLLLYLREGICGL